MKLCKHKTNIVRKCPRVGDGRCIMFAKGLTIGEACFLKPKRTVKPRTRTIHGYVDDFYLRQYQLGNEEEPLYVSRLKYLDIPCTKVTLSYQLPAKGAKGKS